MDFDVWVYINTMHENVKCHQWKYPINEICSTFPNVGLKWEIVYFPYQLPLLGSCKISLCIAAMLNAFTNSHCMMSFSTGKNIGACTPRSW